MAMKAISTIIDDINKARSVFVGIKRTRYDYDLTKALDVVCEIGRSRNPRFVIDEANRFAYTNFVKWVMGDPTMQALDPSTRKPVAGRLDAGIYVAGGTGTGKSWLLEIMSAFCLIDEPRVTLGKTTRPLQWTNYRTDAVCDEYAAKGDIGRFKTIPIVGFQDLGSEPRESLYMGNRLNVLCSIIESRGDRTDLLTLVSSNVPMTHDRMVELYGERAVSRLRQMCNYFEIRGRDRRKPF